MKKIRNLIYAGVVMLAMLTIVSCVRDEKGSAIKDLEQLTEELEQRSGDYKKADWEAAIDKFKEVRQKLDEEKLTAEEKSHVNDLNKRCAKVVAKGAFKEIINGFGDLGKVLNDITSGKELEKAADVVLQGVGEGMQAITDELKKIKKEDIDKAKNDLKDVIDELGRVCKDIGSTLETETVAPDIPSGEE